MSVNSLTTVWCDGSPTADRMSCGAYIEDDTAARVREFAKALGWMVNVKDPDSTVRRDYCPGHAPTDRQ